MCRIEFNILAVNYFRTTYSITPHEHIFLNNNFSKFFIKISTRTRALNLGVFSLCAFFIRLDAFVFFPNWGSTIEGGGDDFFLFNFKIKMSFIMRKKATV
jgi:hypothetical protein